MSHFRECAAAAPAWETPVQAEFGEPWTSPSELCAGVSSGRGSFQESSFGKFLGDGDWMRLTESDRTGHTSAGVAADRQAGS